jgi:hypothetical protein
MWNYEKSTLVVNAFKNKVPAEGAASRGSPMCSSCEDLYMAFERMFNYFITLCQKKLLHHW